MSHTEIAEQKAALRRLLKQRRAAIPHADKQEADRLLCERLLAHAAFRSCRILLTYAPTGSEPQILSLATEALRQGKRVAFPRCGKQGQMRFHFVSSTEELVSGAYGIREPSESAPVYEGEAQALCVVPALAFDKDGYRVGYGGGYYDRFLATFCGVSCGLTYEACLYDTLPRGEFDRPVTLWITEKEVSATDAEREKASSIL